MSKRRAIILAVVLEGRSQTEVAAHYGVSQGWVSKLVAYYRTHGDTAFEPRSKRPHTNPNTTPGTTVELIIELREELTNTGLDAGPETIRWHLETHYQISVSPSTIRRWLVKAGRIEPQPKKRPRSSYIRFQADLPNQTWQSDITHYFLGDPNPNTQHNRAEILTWLDDHSRYAVSVTAHLPVTGDIVVETLKTAANKHGSPASILTDNAFVYTTRFVSTAPNALETYCQQNRIDQKHSRPNHPTTCGKVERFQQTLKNWLRAQPLQPTTLLELQTLLDTFTHVYNHQRPHRSLNRRTPTTAYNLLPKATPATNHETVYRIRHDTIDQFGKVSLRRAGRMHHIGLGRRHAHTSITLIIADLDISIVATETGELLRHLQLDPTRDYQPQQNNKNPNP